MKKKTNKDFINDANKIQGDRYDYSLVYYINNKTKVKIICKIHGIFLQRPDNHLSGQGCALCKNNNIRVTQEEFIEKSKSKFGNRYDYSLVNYINNKTKIILICHIHGIFVQKPDNHLRQKIPCKKCDSENRITDEEILKKRLREIHDNYYDYSLLIYKGRKCKSIIICPIHGEFTQTIHSHILGSGCKKCKSSNGERLVSKILQDMNIEFKIEQTFDNCKFINKLRFDFFIPSLNICIEYNGLQHYKAVPFFGGEKYFSKILKRDNIKKEFCKNNNIKLVIIKYDTDVKEIKDIISSNLCL